MTTIKTDEIFAESNQSFDDAVRQGVEQAKREHQDFHGVEVIRWVAEFDANARVRYQVTLRPVTVQSAAKAPTTMNAMSLGDQAPPGTPGTGENICPVCSGTGKVDGHQCSNCSGTGMVIEGISGA